MSATASMLNTPVATPGKATQHVELPPAVLEEAVVSPPLAPAVEVKLETLPPLRTPSPDCDKSVVEQVGLFDTSKGRTFINDVTQVGEGKGCK